MVTRDQRRASGEPAAEEVAKEEGENLEVPLEVEMPEERAKKFRNPGFQRMRFDWHSDDKPIIDRAKSYVQSQVLHLFSDAYEVINDIYEIVREPARDEAGEPLRDQFGFTIYKSEHGKIDEDFNRLTLRQKEHFMFLITSRMFDWEQRSNDLWLEAMMAKSMFEERFAIGFDAPVVGTVDDRRAAGNLDAREERYFAIYLTALSRRAEGLVRSMATIGQRLKDSLSPGRP